MTPALHYLVNSGLIKEWFSVPCSLFLTEKTTSKKLVITINKSEKRRFYLVEHWSLNLSSKKFLVAKNKIFNHPATIVANYNLLQYKQYPIISNFNTEKSAMEVGLYRSFLENSVVNPYHQNRRINWLWQEFVHKYVPDFDFNDISDNAKADKQRKFVENFEPKLWPKWLTWQEKFLLEPSELVFYKEYSK